jgi:hypothetical protein
LLDLRSVVSAPDVERSQMTAVARRGGLDVLVEGGAT